MICAAQRVVSVRRRHTRVEAIDAWGSLDQAPGHRTVSKVVSRSSLPIVTVVAGVLLLAACDGGLIQGYNEITDLSPRYSPDGMSIAFTSDRGGKFDLYILEIAESEIRQVTDTDVEELDPAWIPDGSGLVYVTQPKGQRGVAASLAAMDLSGESIDVKLSGVYEAFPDVADETRILVSCRIADSFDVCVRGLQQADGAFRVVTEPSARDWQAVWSPDRSTIAFTSDRSGNDDIYLIDVETGEITRITDDPGKDSDPSWSPNGEELAFSSNRSGTDARVGHERRRDGRSNGRRVGIEATLASRWDPDRGTGGTDASGAGFGDRGDRRRDRRDRSGQPPLARAAHTR